MRILRLIIASFFIFFQFNIATSQGCCSGGAGNPIAGGTATGVLQKGQMELSTNYQFSSSNKFFAGNTDTIALFDKLTNAYSFSRIDYGISDRLTMSVASGYYLNRSLIELGQTDTMSSKGFGDLILFPRVDIYNTKNKNSRTEITLGMGIKIPTGSHDDSNLVFSHPLIGDIYNIAPPNIQTTNGSLDLMLYGFLYHAYPKRSLRFFTNTLYIRKGFNSLGQKFGDYTSLGLFASKTFFMRLGLTLQLKGELIGSIKAAKNIDLLARYNIDPGSTASRKIFFIPQISYNYKSLTFFITSEVPIYQNLMGVQIGSQYHINTGLSYRFFANKASYIDDNGDKLL